MEENKLQEVKNSIESSRKVLETAWKNHAPDVSKNIRFVGKPVGDRYLRFMYDTPKDVKRTNFLEQSKYFLAGSYLTALKIGETIFADLDYFRSIFTDSAWIPENATKIFTRINSLWFSAQEAFFTKDNVHLEEILIQLQTELYRLRRVVSTNGQPAKKSRAFYASSVRSTLGRLRIFRILRRK